MKFRNRYVLKRCQIYENSVLTSFSFLFQIVFEGIRGEGYQGDIAIDDIHFVNGICSDNEDDE